MIEVLNFTRMHSINRVPETRPLTRSIVQLLPPPIEQMVIVVEMHKAINPTRV
jgi:hypothetical protein